MSKAPIIGVIPLIDYERNSYWMIPGYMNGLIAAGAFPIILPVITDAESAETAVQTCDGFLFTGGQDVSPEIYHNKRNSACGELSPERDNMEKLILDEAMKKDKPILGICRGIQFINAALGGTLWQDLPSQFSDEVIHCQKPPYDIPIHDVNIEMDSPLYAKLSPELKSMASAPDGLVEAVYAPGHRFLWAVQWHPELAYQRDENSRLIFQEFVRHC